MSIGVWPAVPAAAPSGVRPFAPSQRLRPAAITLLGVFFVVALLLPGGVDQTASAALATLPSRMVWAWERPEDLGWLPPDVGVAYLAATVEIEDDKIWIRLRGHLLRVPPRAALVPVVHVDASALHPPRLSARQLEAITGQVLAAAELGNRQVVQLDFEVRESQRAFLAAVIDAVRRRLPRDTALSVTALASWCADDDWVARLPADEIVPMAFRMAYDGPRIRRMLALRGRFPEPRCRAALGTATDESDVPVTGARRYFFSPQPWSPALWQKVTAPS